MTEATEQYTARWYQRAGVWIGIGINPASITLGAGLASRVAFETLLWLMPLGVAILTALATTAGLIGRWRRQPFSKWSSETFGIGIGAILINLMMGVGMSGWHGFQLGLMGTGMANLLQQPWWVGVILAAVIVVFLLNRGVNRWNWFVWVTTTSSLALAVIGLLLVWGQDVVNTAVAEPLTPSTVIWGIGTIIAFAALFSLRCTDFTWDLASDTDVIIDGAIFFVVMLTSLFIGALLFRSTGDSDLTVILANTPWAILGQVFLVLSLFSAALSSPHSGALAYQHVLPKLKYWQATIFMVGSGFLLGVNRFDQQLLGFLDWVGAILPPAMAVMIVTALMTKRPFSTQLKLAAWLIGAAVALAFKLNDQAVHLVFGALTSFAVLAIGSQLDSRK